LLLLEELRSCVFVVVVLQQAWSSFVVKFSTSSSIAILQARGIIRFVKKDAISMFFLVLASSKSSKIC
jgi:hypothetical protein